jgi:DNA-binding LacI/PurR family transcriptional regulator
MMAPKPKSKSEQNRPVTMADVAKKVGVSRQLVGFVFSGQPGVGTDTEAKIRKAAKDLGYRPNLAAQSLRRDETKYIGLIFYAAEAVMSELLPALQREAHENNFDLLSSAVTNAEEEIMAIEWLRGHRCNGLIFIASHLSTNRLQKLAREIPMVSIGRRLEKVRCGIVSSHAEIGVESAVQHLIDLGHTEITYIQGPDMLDSEFRLVGYKKAIRRAKIKSDVISLPGDFAARGGSRAAEVLLKRKTLPTAVVCNNDESAMGLWHRLLQAGVKIPHDVSIVGYDDSVAGYPYLDMTTVRQDPNELAAAAIADLSARILGSKYLAQTFLTSSKLVVRSSTVKPRKSR